MPIFLNNNLRINKDREKVRKGREKMFIFVCSTIGNEWHRSGSVTDRQCINNTRY